MQWQYLTWKWQIILTSPETPSGTQRNPRPGTGTARAFPSRRWCTWPALPAPSAPVPAWTNPAAPPDRAARSTRWTRTSGSRVPVFGSEERVASVRIFRNCLPKVCLNSDLQSLANYGRQVRQELPPAEWKHCLRASTVPIHVYFEIWEAVETCRIFYVLVFGQNWSNCLHTQLYKRTLTHQLELQKAGASQILSNLCKQKGSSGVYTHTNISDLAKILVGTEGYS